MCNTILDLHIIKVTHLFVYLFFQVITNTIYTKVQKYMVKQEYSESAYLSRDPTPAILLLSAPQQGVELLSLVVTLSENWPHIFVVYVLKTSCPV